MMTTDEKAEILGDILARVLLAAVIMLASLGATVIAGHLFPSLSDCVKLVIFWALTIAFGSVMFRGWSE